MSRLLIIEDDPEITSSLKRGLGLHGYETVSENRARNGLSRLLSEPFAGAIIDVMLGPDSGLDLVRRAREQGVSLPILMLSALSDVEDRAAGLAAGADDYIVKPFTFDELVARLRVQQQRVSVERPAPARLDPVRKCVESPTHSLTLTEREFALLALLSEHPETPLPRATIFETLWAADGSSNENVVDVYIGYLRKKLSDTEFGFEIRTVRHKGFCLTGLTPQHVKPGVQDQSLSSP